MPIISIEGLPGVHSEQAKVRIRETFEAAVTGVRRLGLEPKHVTVRMPIDALATLNTREQEVTINVQGLYNFEKRTPRVLEILALRLGKAARKVFPHAKLIEVPKIVLVDPGSVLVDRRG